MIRPTCSNSNVFSANLQGLVLPFLLRPATHGVRSVLSTPNLHPCTQVRTGSLGSVAAGKGTSNTSWTQRWLVCEAPQIAQHGMNRRREVHYVELNCSAMQKVVKRTAFNVKNDN